MKNSPVGMAGLEGEFVDSPGSVAERSPVGEIQNGDYTDSRVLMAESGRHEVSVGMKSGEKTRLRPLNADHCLLDFNKIKQALYQKGVKCRLLFPARLQVSFGDGTFTFETPENAYAFYNERVMGKE
ncbi:hypothetical protein KUCAC02_003937 [Chaenocephalus aceratus]|uniref:Uncharacterized protein n=1 Tax=Chaenocephalus aceratus TaxID=36190 RepID=A0ACB9WX47_CHAAC|nr:hypothetical protein KUCAC02_003937 [Chaenocephalus aceratus]